MNNHRKKKEKKKESTEPQVKLLNKELIDLRIMKDSYKNNCIIADELNIDLKFKVEELEVKLDKIPKFIKKIFKV